MAKVRSRKQDIAWQYLFERFDIPNQIEKNGGFEITSSDINKYVREFYVNRHDNAPDARNLLKFDFSSELPEVFKKTPDRKIFGQKAKFSLMPMGKDRYQISDFKIFQNLDYEIIEPIQVKFPRWIAGVRPEIPETINSESVAQSVAEMSGMMQFVMDDLNAEIVATLSGKKGTGLIDFKISHYINGPTNFIIDGWQSEIDGVYESPNRVLIIEAKKKRPEDFNIRQLYIPTRIYHDQMKFTKEIYSAYFTYTDDVFSFHVYQFTDIEDFNSLQKIREYEFVFEEESKAVNQEVLRMLLETIPVAPEPRLENGNYVPFIQANDPEKIFEVPVALNGEPIQTDLGEQLEVGSKEFLEETFKFDVRQSDYYGNAAQYVGLVKRRRGGFELTDIGKTYVQSDYNTKILLILEQLVKRPIFRYGLETWLETGRVPDKKKIEKMVDSHPKKLSGKTLPRRVSSVISILKWLIMRIDD